jgi:EAL domain-containing protein (putative c-di-GMP-specific phosphodiesterase class I)
LRKWRRIGAKNLALASLHVNLVGEARMIETVPVKLLRVPQWSLLAHAGGDILPLREFPCVVGRDPSCQVRIVHPTISVQHAEFQLGEEGLVVIDLKSTNGTFVNGERITGEHPLVNGDLVQFGCAVFRLQENSRRVLAATSQSDEVGDLALALAQFDKLWNDQSFIPAYQPIVMASDGRPIAYEVLARSCLFGLEVPAQMFKAAEYFHMEAELSQLLARRAVATSPDGIHLFINTHPTELADIGTLIQSLRGLRSLRPKQPLTLEVHESSVADISTMKTLGRALQTLDMKLAYDDFGAGQARLNELIEAEPAYVKFDRKMIAGIDQAEHRRKRMLKTLVAMCREIGIETLAEGVETAGEAKTCRKLGFQLMQGYYFGRPSPITPGLPLLAYQAPSRRKGWWW